jgi:hypothetical protein
MLTRSKLERINNRPREINRLALAVIGLGSLALGGVLFVLVSSLLLTLAALAAGVLGVLGAYWVRQTNSISSLTYDDLDGAVAARFAAVQEACKDLASSERIWRLSASPEQRSLKAGDVSFPSEREPARVGLLETPGIRANIPIWGIDAGDRKIFFFPEGALIYRGERYEGVSYKSIKVDFASSRFFEEEEVPADAEVVDRTWRFTREDGSPDRRYAPNPQIPVILYGVLRITGPSGLDVRLQVSNRVAAERFARAFGATKRKGAHDEQTRRTASEAKGQENAHPSTEETKAESASREVLGVAEGASMVEITAAYRKLALTYHPDKVANFPREVREFADHKMKEINAAYAQLSRQRRLRPTVFDEKPANAKEGENAPPSTYADPRDAGIL